MAAVQPGVLAPVPPLARYLTFRLRPRYAPRRALLALREIADGNTCVVGTGEQVLRALGAGIAGMRPFPSLVGDGFAVPATPAGQAGAARSQGDHEKVIRTRFAGTR